ncbi:MAG: glutathione binding-like protein, partial [Pantoea sp.]|nr:glutathione binding-like protein [Pantoea sp.]
PHMKMIEQHLAANPWFAGQRFSIADIQMSFPLLALAQRVGMEQMPASQKWLQTVQQRAAWQRAIDQGGELSLPG